MDIKNPFREEEEELKISFELFEMLHNSFLKSDELLRKLKEELV